MSEAVITATRAWVEHTVIGLNLCPFARPVFDANRIRYCVSAATTADELRAELARELTALAQADPAACETTLLIHPQVLTEFFEYSAFLGIAEKCVRSIGLEGEIQIASFHPQYQFAEHAVDAVENYTNRSPYPMLHLLREASIERVLERYPDSEMIYERNIETLRRLGLPRLLNATRTHE